MAFRTFCLGLFCLASACGPRASQRPVAPADLLDGETPPPNAATDPDPFAGCRGIHRDAQTDDIQCPRFAMSVNRSQQTELASMLEAYLDANVRNVDFTDNVTIGSYSITVGDQQFPGRRYRIAPKASVSAEEGFIAAGRIDGETRFVVCLHKEAETQSTLEDDCQRAMAAALTTGLPDTLFPTQTTAADAVKSQTFAGRALTVPAGCKSENGGNRIDCGHRGKLSWVHQPASPRPLSQTAAEIVDRIRGAYAKVGKTYDPIEVACEIDGVATTCTKITAEQTDIVEHYYVGIATVREVKVLVLCSWADQDQPQVPPPPCDQVLAASR